MYLHGTIAMNTQKLKMRFGSCSVDGGSIQNLDTAAPCLNLRDTTLHYGAGVLIVFPVAPCLLAPQPPQLPPDPAA